MTGMAKGKSIRTRRRKHASTEYAPGLNPEHREAARVGRDRQEKAQATAVAARAEAWLIGRARGQMRNAREEAGEAVQLFQLRYPDRVPADSAVALAKPLALVLRLFTTSVATAKGRELSAELATSHVARHLRGLLPLASSSTLASAIDFRQYLGTGRWPNVQERSAMLGVTAAECDAIDARHLKPTDLSPEQMRERKNRIQRERDAQRTPEEKEARNARDRADRAAKRAERRTGSLSFIVERVQALGGTLNRSTVERWIDRGVLRQKLIERIAQVKDSAEAERTADIILGKFNAARRSAAKGASAVGNKRRQRPAAKSASAVGGTGPYAPPVQGGPEIGGPAPAPASAADASKVASAAYKEMGQTRVLPQIVSAGGGQASSLPPAPLNIETDNITGEEPMSEQTANVTMPAGPDGPPASNSAPEYRELAAEFARHYALTGDEAALSANLQRLAEVAVRHGAAKLYEQEKADRDRRNQTFMLFVKHPAYATASSVALRLAHADRTPEEIRTVLDIIGETPTMDETAGEMAAALFKQGHTPAVVATLLLNASGIRGRA